MKALILKSNHGNQNGFNRKWEILNSCNSEDIFTLMTNLLDNVANEYGLSEEYVENNFSLGHSFEYDLYYYISVTQDDYDNGFFDGGHYGYANQEIINYFEN